MSVKAAYQMTSTKSKTKRNSNDSRKKFDIVWHRFNTQKFFFNFPDFEKNLCNVITDA